MLGHDVGGLRLPLVEATASEREAVRAMLERHGLLAGAGTDAAAGAAAARASA
jgi:4-hydroxy-tetrahydrodipicolinate synthase